MRTTLIPLLLLLAIYTAQAQATIKGLVTDINGEPIEAAHVLSTDSTVTDAEGYFSLQVPKGIEQVDIQVNVLGYLPEKMEVTLPMDSLLVIKLLADKYELPEVPILSDRPYTIMLEAIKKLQAAMPDTAYLNNCFYRQIHREDGKYVRLIEADVDILNNAENRPKDFLKINQMRRSMVYERNGGQHDDHLVDLLLENYATHPSGTILDPRTLSSYELHIEAENMDSTIITYSYNHFRSEKHFTGQVLLDAKGRIVRIIEQSTDNPKYQPGGMLGSASDTWEFVNGDKALHYSYPNGTLQLDSINYNYLHNITDRFSGRTHYVIEEYFQLWVSSTTTIANPDMKPYKALSGLYTKPYKYNIKFWNNYSALKQHPLPIEVKLGLNKYKELEGQYSAEGK